MVLQKQIFKVTIKIHFSQLFGLNLERKYQHYSNV